MEEIRFGIKTITYGNGFKKYVPVIKKDYRWFFKIFSQWERIVLVDGVYYTEGLMVSEIDLTIEQCHEYIKGYKMQIQKENDLKIVSEDVQEI